MKCAGEHTAGSTCCSGGSCRRRRRSHYFHYFYCCCCWCSFLCSFGGSCVLNWHPKFHSLALLCAVATSTLLGKRGKRSCEGADVHAQLALHWDFSFGAPITQFLISSLLRYYGQLCKVAVCVCERVFVCALELLVVGPTPCHTADWRTGLVYLNGYVCVCAEAISA